MLLRFGSRLLLNLGPPPPGGGGLGSLNGSYGQPENFLTVLIQTLRRNAICACPQPYRRPPPPGIKNKPDWEAGVTQG